MKALGDYIHSKGLRFGIYSSAGTKTCEGRPGSLDYEETDANSFASWGVDYLKYDNCYNKNLHGLARYPKMRDALAKSGRKIFYSICNWGEDNTMQWGPATGNSWRTTMDIKDYWASMEYNFFESQKFAHIAGSGGWNDPDILEVGNGGMTNDEEKTHFALSAIAKAPLIIGCDLTTVKADSLAILMNEKLIAVNQDPNSKQAVCTINCSMWHRFIRTP